MIFQFACLTSKQPGKCIYGLWVPNHSKSVNALLLGLRQFFEEFVAIVLMVAFMVPEQVAKVSGRQFLEIFSGRARTARLASWCGFVSSSIDIQYHSRAFNVLKPAGFTFLSYKLY